VGAEVPSEKPSSAKSVRHFTIEFSEFDNELAYDVMHYVAGDIGEAKIPTAVAVSQLGVIHTEQVEGGGVEIVNVDGLIDGLEAEVVGGSIGCATL
jgi:hypothetical protein